MISSLRTFWKFSRVFWNCENYPLIVANARGEKSGKKKQFKSYNVNTVRILGCEPYKFNFFVSLANCFLYTDFLPPKLHSRMQTVYFSIFCYLHIRILHCKRRKSGKLVVRETRGCERRSLVTIFKIPRSGPILGARNFFITTYFYNF
jgi:hypothetical protein